MVVGTISILYVGILLGIVKKYELPQAEGSTTEEMLTQLLPMTVLPLLLWWIAAAFVLTCSAPFAHSGNGYFSCWGAAFTSLYLTHHLNHSAGLLRESIHWAHEKAGELDTPQWSLLFLLIFSVIELIEASVECDVQRTCVAQYGWGAAVGAISVFVSFLALVFIDPHPVEGLHEGN